jgi:ABC-type Fe3+/spermidine/putrescine transport system ATPase subunit
MNFSIDLFHSFSTFQGIQKIEANLQIPLGEYVSISGISGSGKTTFLRLISGLILFIGESRFGTTPKTNNVFLHRKEI